MRISDWSSDVCSSDFHAAQSAVLSGTEFNLDIAQTPANLTGAPRMATTVNGMLPAPTLRWREGDTVTLRVTNRLEEDTSIHRSEEHTSELQSPMRTSYAVFCLKKKTHEASVSTHIYTTTTHPQP